MAVSDDGRARWDMGSSSGIAFRTEARKVTNPQNKLTKAPRVMLLVRKPVGKPVTVNQNYQSHNKIPNVPVNIIRNVIFKYDIKYV